MIRTASADRAHVAQHHQRAEHARCREWRWCPTSTGCAGCWAPWRSRRTRRTRTSTRIAILANSWSYIRRSPPSESRRTPRPLRRRNRARALPSVINSSSSARDVLRYSSLACSGIVAGRFNGDAIVTPCLTTVWPGSVSSQLPPVSPARSTTTLPGFIPSHRGGGHQPRRRPARHQRGRDHHVELGDRLLERLLLLRRAPPR